MADLKRKVTALLLALIFVAGTVAISGCKGDNTTSKPKAPANNKKVPKDLE